jgi:ABC-type antimicrobial peptide transport system permease subunit
MRTLGYRRTHILSFILSESVVMALLGGLFGVALARFVFVPMIKAVGSKTSLSGFLINFKVSPATLLMAFTVSVAVGILAGFVPAIRSSQIRIVDGLRKVV